MIIWKTISRRPARAILAICALLMLAAGLPPGAAQARQVVEPQSIWKYNDSGKDLGTAWRARDYDDQAWKSGAAPLGYGNPDVKTELSFGPNSKSKYPTYYFRQSFTVTDTQSIDSLRLNIRYDDGFVAYLNGTEIARGNIPITQTLSFNLLAAQAHRGRTAEVFELVDALPLLVPGANVLAIEVHQETKDSGKLLLEAALDAGLITDPPAFLADPKLSQLTDTSVHVQFQNNVRTQARVEYGVSPATDLSAEIGDRISVHDIALSALQPNTTYRYRVGVRTRADQPYVWSQPADFQTLNPQKLAVVGHSVIPAQGEWKYNDSGANLGERWRAPEFDDTAWKSGVAPLGYEYPETATTISYGADSKNKFVTAYFRKAFTITDTKQIEGLELNARYDDGLVAYLNGVEVVRANMPITSTVEFGTFANGSHPGSGIEVFDLAQSRELLKTGQNVLAVEVHQASKGSSDLLFDTALSIVLVTDPPVLVAPPILGQVTAQSVHVQFESNVPTLAVVEYGVSPATDLHVESAEHSTTHDLTLTGLQPGATYRYRVGLRTTADQPLAWSEPFDFTTDGGAGSSFRFGVWADSRPDSGTEQPPVFVRNLRNLAERKPLALAVSIGDNVQLRGLSDSDPTITSTVRSAYMGYYKAVGSLASSVPLYTALGNHDNPGCATCLAAFQRYFPNPTVNGERFYSFDYGDAHFTVADSRQSSDGGNAGLSPQQRRWLRDDLLASTKRYKFVFIHDAMFHNQDSEVYRKDEKAELHQLFLSAGVTAVFQGDAHYYDYTVEDGLPYIITGGAGSPLYKNPFNSDWSENEALIVSVSATEVGFQAIKADGTILDRRVLSARPMTALPAVQAPSGAAQPAVAPAGQSAAAPASRGAGLIWLLVPLILGLALGLGALLLALWLRQRRNAPTVSKSQTKA
jgi:hypothetical protein